jgi:hypothetical protein
MKVYAMEHREINDVPVEEMVAERMVYAKAKN